MSKAVADKAVEERIGNMGESVAKRYDDIMDGEFRGLEGENLEAAQLFMKLRAGDWDSSVLTTEEFELL